MHNTLRHAEAKNVYISLKTTQNKIEMTVQDDGRGFDVSTSGSGHGLLSLHQRAKSLKGYLTIESNLASGTLTCFTCPLAEGV